MLHVPIGMVGIVNKHIHSLENIKGREPLEKNKNSLEVLVCIIFILKSLQSKLIKSNTLKEFFCVMIQLLKI
jgi:hypothetical protein